jgi:hypothetical protein
MRHQGQDQDKLIVFYRIDPFFALLSQYFQLLLSCLPILHKDPVLVVKLCPFPENGY